MTANYLTKMFSGLVTGTLLFASALAAEEARPGKPGVPDKPPVLDRLGFTNSDPAVVGVLSAEGIVAGEQISTAGRTLGNLVVDGPMAATYPLPGEQRATLMLDNGKDAYRFAGAAECAGLVEVEWSQPILEGQIRAFVRAERGRYVTQAASTLTEPATRQYLAVRGGSEYRLQVLWSQGMDDSGNPATFSRTVETAVRCDQVVKLSIGAPAHSLAEIAGATDLFLGIPAELPIRPSSKSLLDVEDTSVREFDNVLDGGETSSCQTDDFNDGDLAGWTFANVGDSNQGGATVVGGKLQLTSDGTTFYHDGDNGGFVYQSITGDFRAQVKITGFPVNAGGGYRKSGITIRTGTGPNDPRIYAEFLPMHPFYNQTAIMFDYRDTSGNESELASTPLNVQLPAYLAVERRGNKFSVYFSANGVNWAKPAGAAGGSITIPMPGTVAVGMMQASYDANIIMTSEFDDFKVCRPNVIPLPPFPPHGVCAPGVPIDIVYLLDSTGSMTVPFSDGVTKLDAARNAMVAMNDLIESSLPGSRAALVTFQGGFTPAFNQTSAVHLLSNLTTDFDAVEAAAAAINVNAINPDATTPIAIALDRTLTILQNQGNYQSTPVVVFIGDGWANIDYAGNGPLEYLRPEMGAISIIQSGNFIPWGLAAWLGNWNGAINTYDGEPLANAMYQTLRMKSTMPELLMFTVGVNSGDYRPDLLSFMALYTGGDFYQVNNATEMLDVLEGIYNGIDCGAEIGDTVWNDANGNGVQDGEPGLASVTVELVDDNGDVVDTQVTDVNGHYLFTGVFPGTYTVRVVASTLPSGVDVQTYDYDGIGTANAATVTVIDDQSFLEADFGYRAGVSSIGDRVWNDADGDGIQDGGEGGLLGVTVELLNSGGTVIASDVTDLNGNYLFENLPSSTYTVRVVSGTLPGGVTATFDRDGIATLHTAVVTVCCDQSVLDADFGYRQASGAIGDRVWNDLDGDGVQDVGEGGLNGVTVELLNSGGTVIASQVTNANGDYLFSNLLAGTYTVRVVPAGLPSGSTATFDRDGIATLHTAVVTLAANQVVLDADFGYRQASAKIGDRVWNDVNGDGVQDVGEGGLSGVTVELLNSGGTVIASQVTNANGDYLFTGLVAGTYTVRVVPAGLPSGSTATFDRDGIATLHTALVTLTPNQIVLDADFGYRQASAKIGDRVWNDIDGDGVQDVGEGGLLGVTVELLNSGGTVIASQVTNANGDYLFTGLVAGTYTVRVVPAGLPSGSTATFDRDGIATLHTAVVTLTANQIVLDADFGYRQASAKIGDRVWNDIDGDGVQDVGEGGLTGVTVELLNSGGTVIASQVTNANGDYLFTGLIAGTYTVRVVPAGLPSGSTATFDRDGIATLHTAAVTLTANQIVLDADFGYRQASAKIGDRVWNDADGDGVQDVGETGLNNVTVQLLNSGGTVIASQVTNSNGDYLFTGLIAGNYTVKVLSSSLPAGATATFDRDGIATLHTAAVTLTANQIVLDADFGYRLCLGSIGDRVWDDKDGDGVQDSGETGIPGVQLQLLNSGGTVIATTTTNSSGNYTFGNLVPGTYTVQVVTSSLPAGSTATFDRDGVITPNVAVVTLTCNQKVTNADFGYRECNGDIGDRVWDDKDGDGVQDSGEGGISGVTVQLVNSGGTVIATDVTDGNGNYTFENVVPGTYTVKVVALSLPANATATYDKDGIATLHQATLTITCNQKVTNIDFGYRVCDGGVLGDRVWFDKNKNASQDSGESGIPGVTVQLLNSSGVVIATDVTDSNGNYLFEGLGAGSFTVRIVTSTLPAGAAPTFDRDGISTPHQAATTLTCNQKRTNIDFGYDFPEPAMIAGHVWNDDNGDGKIDGGEAMLSNVTVQLLNSQGTVIATDVTDSRGSYSFENLAAGTYTVKVVSSTLPPDMLATYDYDGIQTLHLAVVTVGEGEEILDVDFGYQFEDANGAWCPRTPGFWKTHPEVWPVTSLTFGGVTYNTSQLMTFLNYGGSDASTKLAHHLTATMLNLAMGSNPTNIQSTVNQASTFLITKPPGSNPTGSSATTANNLKNILDKWNNDPACH